LGVWNEIAVCADKPSRVGTGCGSRNLLPQNSPDRKLGRVHRPRDAPTGVARHKGRHQLVLGQDSVNGNWVGVEVEHPPASADGPCQVALVAERDLTGDVVSPRLECNDGVSVWEAHRSSVGASQPFLHPRNGGRRQVAKQVVRAERLPERQSERQPAWSRRSELWHTSVPALTSPARGVSAKLRRRQGEDLLDRVVEGANAGKPGREGDITDREGARLDENPCGLGPLGSSQSKWTGPDLGGELSLDLANAVAESAGQSGHALTVNDTIRDEPHGPRDQVRAQVPLRRPGTCIGPAAFAGPKPRLLSRGGAGVEAKVLQVWPGGTARSTVDARRHDGAEEPSVEACVPGPYGARAGFHVLMHVHQHDV
jgi:hypothetical protein